MAAGLETIHGVWGGRFDAVPIEAGQSAMERFWRWVHERQSVWHRRHALGLDAPWSDDPIFMKYNFCNVMRDLDAGTIVLKEDVLDTDLSVTEKVHGTIFYRLYNNRDTWRNVTGIVTTQTGMIEWQQRLLAVPNPWSKAWISSATSRYAARIVAADYSDVVAVVEKTDSTTAVHEVIRRHFGLTGLVGFQMAMDLTTLVPRKNVDKVHTYASAFQKTGRGFTKSGGSESGAYAIDPDATPVETMLNLQQSAQSHLAAYGLDWSAVAAPGYEEIYLQDVEHSLCEFMKYERARTGVSKTPTRLYRHKA